MGTTGISITIIIQSQGIFPYIPEKNLVGPRSLRFARSEFVAGYFKSGMKRLGKISATKTQVLVLIWAAFQQ
jgi:hypothetical protein